MTSFDPTQVSGSQLPLPGPNKTPSDDKTLSGADKTVQAVAPFAIGATATPVSGAAASGVVHSVTKVDERQVIEELNKEIVEFNADAPRLQSLMQRQGLDYLLNEGKDKDPKSVAAFQAQVDDMRNQTSDLRKLANMLYKPPVNEENPSATDKPAPEDASLSAIHTAISERQQLLLTLSVHEGLDKTTLDESTSLMMQVTNAASTVLSDWPKDLPPPTRGDYEKVIKGIDAAISSLSRERDMKAASILISDLLASKHEIQEHLKSVSN